MLEKVISGGQSGVDRAALDVAIKFNISHGGWCPKGRLSELGLIPDKYILKETLSRDYSVRTKLNVRDSDGTLILVPTYPLKTEDGTILTIEEVKKKEKPHFIVELSKENDMESIYNWMKENNIHILNIAGPRESKIPGIYQTSFIFLEKFLIFLNTKQNQDDTRNTLKAKF